MHEGATAPHGWPWKLDNKRTTLALAQEEDLESTSSFDFSFISLRLESFVNLLADLLRLRLVAFSSPTLLGGLVDGWSGESRQRVQILVERTAHLDAR